MNQRPKILIVDDKVENLFALEVVLRELDVDIIKATNGNDALKATLNHDFSLALLDVQMPDMDGYELATILREEEKTSRMPFIFISAVFTDNPAIFKGYEKGAFSFITKPFQPEILRNKVRFFIEKYQHEIEIFEVNKKLEQRNLDLLEINQDLESFSYSVSHDLMAPVRAIRLYSEMLESNCGDKLDEKSAKLLGKIQKNSVKISSLIKDLLEFSQLGRKEITKVEIDMNDLVASVVQDQSEFVIHNASINVHNMPPIFGDTALLRQVWSNLISNAIKYSNNIPSPEIEIGANESDHYVQYYIKDNGVGFDMEHASKLFGVFQRLHSETDFKGIGIGLAIVERILAKHRGKIWADSKVNQGSTFYFEIPKPEIEIE